jgi:beta,beta-carotene 9',10'-dioxygenase
VQEIEFGEQAAMLILDEQVMIRPGYLPGLATLESEVSHDRLPVEGTIPRWLSGTLVRNGPAKFEVGDAPLCHWFDGLAMLHRFSFSEGHVSYANRYLRTEAFRASERGDIPFGAFATAPHRSLIGRAKSMIKPSFTDNCNFGVARFGDTHIAMTETPAPVAFDLETLETLDIPYSAPGHHVTAHPHHDPGAGELVASATRFGRHPTYRVFSQTGRDRQRIVAEIPAGEPSYMHSFGLTERHILLTACPFVVNPLQLGLSGRPFIENFRWEPERGTTFFVIDRHSGGLRGSFETRGFFAFHHVNTFERGREVVADLITYDSPSVIDALYMEELRTSAPSEKVHGRLNRFRIDTDGKGVVEEQLCEEMLELPQIDYGARNGKPYRYVYGAAVDTDTGGEPADFLDRIVKVDVKNGRMTPWQEPASYPGEPIFVPSPEPGRDEDDGVLLSVVLDSRGPGSYLLVLDAKSLAELGRAFVPHHIPLGFHGQYFD